MVGHSWRFPAHPLRGSFVATTVAALAVLVGMASGLRAGLPLGGLYLWKAIALFAAMLLMALGYVGANHPFTRFGPANQVTTIRLMLVALIAGLVGEAARPELAGAAVVVTAVVATLDGLDGWLARRTGMASDFGARFDMVTDALLILVLSVLVWEHGKAGAWVLGGGLMRYGFIAAGWIWSWMANPLTPTRRAKTVAVSHMLGLGVALAPIVPATLSSVAAALTLAALAWSFAVDVGRLWRSR